MSDPAALSNNPETCTRVTFGHMDEDKYAHMLFKCCHFIILQMAVATSAYVILTSSSKDILVEYRRAGDFCDFSSLTSNQGIYKCGKLTFGTMTPAHWCLSENP